MILTSNNTRELSEALKRRCLYLHIDYPDSSARRTSCGSACPRSTTQLAEQIAQVVRSIRALDLKKAPSISETIDWARTLLYLGKTQIDPEVIGETLHVLLKYQSDIAKARKELGSPEPERVARLTKLHRSARRARGSPRRCSTSSRASCTSCAPPGCRSR